MTDVLHPPLRPRAEVAPARAECRAGPAPDEAARPLSAGQKALWFLHRSAPDSPAYNVAFTARLRGGTDAGALERAAQRLVARHPQLSVVFETPDGAPAQRVRRRTGPLLRRVDAAGLDAAGLHEAVAAAHAAPFDLRHGPLLRLTLFSRGAADHVLLLSAHHIVLDGWSLWIAIDELGALYAAETAGEAASLPAPAGDYAAHVEAERARLAGPEGERLWRFWRERLADATAVLDLPTDRPRPPERRLRGDAVRVELDRGLCAALKALARRLGVTPYALFLSAWQVFLARHAGQDVVLVGTPLSGREDPAMAGVIGHFVNPVVLRADLADDPGFADLVATTHRAVLDARDHQDMPFPVLVERLAGRRDPSVSPVFQASFVMQQAQRAGSALQIAAGGGRWGDLRLEHFEMAQQTGQFDLELELMAVGPAFSGWLKYDTALFDAATIERYAERLVALLRAVVVDPGTSVKRLDLLGRADRTWLRVRAPAPAAVEATACVHERFAAVARTRPDAVALVDGDAAMTYGDLDARANRLANHLRARGVGPGVLVGLCLERSFDLVVAVIAILKAGGAYVPLDPRSPRERVGLILEDSEVGLVITETALEPLVAGRGAAMVRTDADAEAIAAESAGEPVSGVALSDPIYVIYTSGTTGRPKGVKLSHGNVARLFTATASFYRFGADDVWTLFHSIAFDVSVWEMWGALLHGGRLVVVPYLVSRSPAEFLSLLSEHGVTVLNQSPSAFRPLVEAEARHPLPEPARLAWIVFSGEPLDLPSLRAWIARHGDARPTLVNMYGITEVTVHATIKVVRAADLERTRATIGAPIADLRLDLLDPLGAPVPVGVPGEIHVAGKGVALGYHARPELTAARFLPDPGAAEPEARRYRSGDLARYLPDGDIEYLGRIDTQVKLRGFRIELGEIEATLATHADVADAVVVGRDLDGARARLVAYVVARAGAAADPGALRRHLAARLPEYMVPARFVALEALPLTGNGTLDRRALPDDADLEEDARPVAAPRDTLEQRLVAIWEKLLRRRPVGIRDDFFALGGHSLLAVQMMAEIGAVLGEEPPVATLFRNPTIEALAVELRRPRARAGFTPLVPVQMAGTKRPFFCVAGGGGNVLYFHHLAHAMPPERAFLGLQLPGVDGESAPLGSIEAIAATMVEAVLAAQPEGPYLLGGHCFGALVAFETAQQLLARGHAVASVTVLDAPAPRPGAAIAPAALDEAAWLAKGAGALAEAAGIEPVVGAGELAPLDEAARLSLVETRLAGAGLLPPGASSAAIRGFLAVFMANGRIRYAPRAPRPVPIRLLRAAEANPDYDYAAAEDEGVPRARSTLGWGALASEIAVHAVPGDHLTMLAPPHADRLAAVLADALDGT
ncbi:MAG: amino acid adenylation domain-containing protein [Paracoccaceae bacterium]